MKERIQSFGRFLSGMVMPNIGAFIAWGLLTALFIDTGWLPNAQLSTIVGPMLTKKFVIGPFMGAVLVAYWLFSKDKTTKASAPIVRLSNSKQSLSASLAD